LDLEGGIILEGRTATPTQQARAGED